MEDNSLIFLYNRFSSFLTEKKPRERIVNFYLRRVTQDTCFFGTFTGKGAIWDIMPRFLVM